MQTLLQVLVTAVVLGVPLAGLAWAARRVRRRGGGESLMQPFDMIWRPAAYHARLEVQSQEEQPAPSPLPGDKLV